MVDREPIPLVGPGEASVGSPPSSLGTRGIQYGSRSRSTGSLPVLSWLMLLLLPALHSLAIWTALGGLEGLTNGWPIWRDDHPLYYHSALVTRSFLERSGTTAGYDPSFMAGYAKSVVFPSSSTLPELVVWWFGGARPELAYKLYVLISASLVPWLLAVAAGVWGLSPRGAGVSVLLLLAYIWTDFPINYAAFGMLPYFLSVPLGLLATGLIGRFLVHGGMFVWVAACLTSSLALLVHLTSAMTLVPAAALAYLVAVATPERFEDDREPPEGGLPLTRHSGIWLIPAVALTANAFWWLPGLWLASTKGPSDFAFAHPEGSLTRLLAIWTREPVIQSILVGLGVPGIVVLIRQGLRLGMGLVGFCLAGFFWGYLAGEWRAFDFLQPGRHTYAFYSGLSLAGGACLDAVLRRLRSPSRTLGRLDRLALVALWVVSLRLLAVPVIESVRYRVLAPEPFLSSRPSPRLLWVVDQVKRWVEPGERLLYEEGGFDLPGIPDPYQRGRFSGLLPDRTGVEVIGGPYLHASLATNFTQFGEGSLFGKSDWDRDHFVRYARLYRPAAILCWSPAARRFCRSHPDLITVREDDGIFLIGRVEGFQGDAIVGAANVAARPGRLSISGLVPGLDGSVVLRYHSVPCLRARPPILLEPLLLEEDPVPFIRLRPPPGTNKVELEMIVPLGIAWPRGRG